MRKRNRKIDFKTSTETKEKIDKFCNNHNFDRSKLIDCVIENFLDGNLTDLSSWLFYNEDDMRLK